MDDRRAMAGLLVVAAFACSGKHDANEAPAKPSQAALDHCAQSAAAAAKALADNAASGRFTAVDATLRGEVACADLYRQPACAAAWRKAFTADDVAMDDAAKRVAAACSAAYCPHLSPAPALCIHALEPAAPNGLDWLRDLDTAILSAEGVDPAIARAIADGRVALFRGATAQRAEPPPAGSDAPPPLPETLVLEVNAFGALVANDRPLPRAELPAVLAGLAERKGRLVVEPSHATAQAKVIEIMDQAKQAGITSLAIGVRKN